MTSSQTCTWEFNMGMFTDAFTKKYPEIAARSPVYAQLRNLVDMAVAAAYLQEHDAYRTTRQWQAK